MLEYLTWRARLTEPFVQTLKFSELMGALSHALDKHRNGQGRPNQLTGAAIPINACIALLAQVIDVGKRRTEPTHTTL